MSVKIAVVGATGNLGREVLTTLAERGVPVASVVALASGKSMGGTLSYGEDEDVTIRTLDAYTFAGIDIALFAAGSEVSKRAAGIAIKAGAVVIDASPAHRLEPGVPLIVPSLNREDIAGFGKKRLLASPGAATIALARVIAPLNDAFTVKRAVVTSLHSASGLGREAMDELFTQTRGIYVNDPPAGSQKQFPKQIAFNVIPQVDGFASDGATLEEEAVAQELLKLIDGDLLVHANAAHVAAFVGVSGFLGVEFERPITLEAVRKAFRREDGVTIIDHRVDGGYATPVEGVGEEAVFLSRLRMDRSLANGLSLWWTADNLKIAALNAVETLEILRDEYL